MSELPLLGPSDEVGGLPDVGLPVGEPGLRLLPTSGLGLLGVKGVAHLTPALGGGASESVGEFFLRLPLGETARCLTERSDAFLSTGGGLFGELDDGDALEAGVLDSDATFFAEVGLEEEGVLVVSMVSFLSLIMPLRRILRGVEAVEASDWPEKFIARLSRGLIEASSCHSWSSLVWAELVDTILPCWEGVIG